jgi:hypothetical protein
VIEDGKWFRAPLRWRHVCCDCELSHHVVFRIRDTPKGRIVEQKWTTDDRGTAARRRPYRFTKEAE